MHDSDPVTEARAHLYESLFGPMPEQAMKLMEVAPAWPRGCLVQIPSERLGEKWVTASFGLTNPDMPGSVRVVNETVQDASGGSSFSTRLETKPRPHVPEGVAGYGFEFALVTERRMKWVPGVLSWVIKQQVNDEFMFLDAIAELGAATTGPHPDGKGGSLHFLIAPAWGALPERAKLPNGDLRFLVLTAMTRDEAEFAGREGPRELLGRLKSAGVGPDSILDRRSALL